MKNWKITYAKNSVERVIIKELSTQPDLDEAALMIRDDVLTEGFLLVDQFRDATDKNFELLKHNGILVLSVDELIE